MGWRWFRKKDDRHGDPAPVITPPIVQPEPLYSGKLAPAGSWHRFPGLDAVAAVVSGRHGGGGYFGAEFRVVLQSGRAECLHGGGGRVFGSRDGERGGDAYLESDADQCATGSVGRGCRGAVLVAGDGGEQRLWAEFYARGRYRVSGANSSGGECDASCF